MSKDQIIVLISISVIVLTCLWVAYEIGKSRGLNMGIVLMAEEFKQKYEDYVFLHKTGFYLLTGMTVDEYKAAYGNKKGKEDKDTKKPSLTVIKNDDT